jgi:hypothetical protein
MLCEDEAIVWEHDKKQGHGLQINASQNTSAVLEIKSQEFSHLQSALFHVPLGSHRHVSLS